MAAVLCLASADRAPITMPPEPGLPDLDGIRLRIFDRIEPGLNVVAIVGDDVGSHLLQEGEVAVYDERWREDPHLAPGLYVIEFQRPPASMPARMIAERFAANDPVRMVCEREVVMVFRHPRCPEHWAYRQLRSRVHRGIRFPVRTEGPIYDWGLRDMLLGPVVGIYQPRQFGGEQ